MIEWRLLVDGGGSVVYQPLHYANSERIDNANRTFRSSSRTKTCSFKPIPLQVVVATHNMPIKNIEQHSYEKQDYMTLL